jgi:electron transport complex protein RnfG
MNARALKDSYLGQAWLVLALALAFAAALAAVQAAWGPRIEQNKRNDARRRIPALLLGPMTPSEARRRLAEFDVDERQFTVTARGTATPYTAYRVRRKADGRMLGWVVKGKGAGYADTIELLVGLDPSAERLLGMDVLSQNETPGLGNRIQELEFRVRFSGKSADEPLVAVKDAAEAPNEIVAVTSATISSASVCDIVNRTGRDVRQAMRDEPGRGQESGHSDAQ